MDEQRDGFTIQVHGDVPQEALDGLVAAIPVRTVIVGAGPNAHAMPVDDVNKTFGAGSEAATMVHTALKHKPYETWQEREARRDREDFDKATKIDAKAYEGWVSWPGRGEDGFFKSVDELRAHCVNHKLALPLFVWACTPDPLKLHANWILDQAMDEHHDDARGEVSAAEEERLQKFLDEWCAAQGIVSWHEDRTQAVILPAADNVTDRICGLDRKALISALEWQAQEWVEEFMLHDMARLSDEPIKSCFTAIVDPAKLAEIIAELLRGFGFLIIENGDDPGDDMRFPAAEVFAENGTVAMHLYKTWKDCEDEPSCVERPMSAARDLALCLLQLPEGATAEDASREVEKRS